MLSRVVVVGLSSELLEQDGCDSRMSWSAISLPL